MGHFDRGTSRKINEGFGEGSYSYGNHASQCFRESQSDWKSD